VLFSKFERRGLWKVVKMWKVVKIGKWRGKVGNFGDF
jgi:hypothetical protein